MLKIRGHHLICRLGFRGLGYDKDFVEKMTEVVNMLSESADTQVQIVDKPDVICGKCPNLREENCNSIENSQSEKNISEMDRIVMETLNIKRGEIYSIEHINKKIRLHFNNEIFRKVCGKCHWVSLGYCEEGLRKITDKM